MKTMCGAGLRAAAVFAVFLVAGVSTALAKDFKYFRSAKAATEIRLIPHTSFRGDCETKAAVIKILDMPKNGEAKVKTGTRRFPKGGKGRMARCDGKRGAAAAVFYKSKSGFEGFDQLRYEVTFNSGRKNTITFRLRIGSPKKAGDDKGWVKAK